MQRRDERDQRPIDEAASRRGRGVEAASRRGRCVAAASRGGRDDGGDGEFELRMREISS